MLKLFGDDCRNQYLDATPCICIADGGIVAPQSLRVRSMNFGQHWRTEGIREVSYSVELPHRFWMDVFARELPEIVEDARKFPDDDRELEAALRLRGLPAAINENTALELAPLFVRDFAHDLLLEWLGDGYPSVIPGFVINTIDDVTVAVDRVRLSGLARTDEIAVRYQDV
ncbi:MAG TPA: hypothetical protein PK156_42700 [Polyangium sp.]|nr:hypothetical protein [Polyangium sp.]